MSMVAGLIILVALWAMLIAWVAKIASSLGHNIALWSLTAALLGALGFAAGLVVASHSLDASDDKLGLSVLAVLLPGVFMVAAMVAVAILLQRGVIGAPKRKKWPVHIMEHGPGWLTLEGDRIVFEWDQGSRDVTLSKLEGVHADGECVRVRAGDEIVVMPRSETLSPEGRRRVTAQITQRLRLALPVAVLRR